MFFSAHLSRLPKARSRFNNFDISQGRTLHQLFMRMGFSKLETDLKWKGSACTVWLRNGVELTNDEIRSELSNFDHNSGPTYVIEFSLVYTLKVGGRR